MADEFYGIPGDREGWGEGEALGDPPNEAPERGDYDSAVRVVSRYFQENRQRPPPEVLRDEPDEKTKALREKATVDVFQRVADHDPLRGGTETDAGHRLATYIDTLIMRERFYWREAAGFGDPRDTFGREPATFQEVRRAAAMRLDEALRDLPRRGISAAMRGAYRLDPREFLGRWCPVCHMEQEQRLLARGDGEGSATVKALLDYYQVNRRMRPAALYQQLAEIYNERAVQTAAKARGFTRRWGSDGNSHLPAGAIDLSGIPPECGPEFFESHFEGGPCQSLNERYVLGLMLHAEAQKMARICSGGLYADDGAGGVMVSLKMSSEHRSVGRVMRDLLKGIDAASESLYDKSTAVADASHLAKRQRAVAGTNNVALATQSK